MKQYFFALLFGATLCCICFADELPSVTVRANGQDIRINRPDGTDAKSFQKLISNQIKSRIVSSEIKKAGINISESVLSKCLDAYVSTTENPINIVNAVALKSDAVARALKKVVINSENKDKVYNENLRELISQQEWEMWISSYKTESQISELEKLIPHTVDDLKQNTRDGLRADIETWYLLNKITNGIPPFSQTVNQLALEEAKKAAINRWWRELLANTKIEFPKEYPEVEQLVKAPPGIPFLPPSVVAILRQEKSKDGSQQ